MEFLLITFNIIQRLGQFTNDNPIGVSTSSSDVKPVGWRYFIKMRNDIIHNNFVINSQVTNNMVKVFLAMENPVFLLKTKLDKEISSHSLQEASKLLHKRREEKLNPFKQKPDVTEDQDPNSSLSSMNKQK